MVCGCRFSFRFLFPEGLQKADVTSVVEYLLGLHMNFWLGVVEPGYQTLRGGKSGLVIQGGLGRHEDKDWVGIAA